VDDAERDNRHVPSVQAIGAAIRSAGAIDFRPVGHVGLD
jgi:hypothetical protein